MCPAVSGTGSEVRRSGCSEWGGFRVGVSVCFCRWHARPLFDRFGGHRRVSVRAIDMRPPSAAPCLDGVATARLGRGHHGDLPGVSHGSSCSRTRGHAGGAAFPAGSASVHRVFSLLGCSGSRGRWAGGEGQSTRRWSGEFAVVRVSTMVGVHIFRCVVASLAASRRSPRPRRDGGHRDDRVHGLACHLPPRRDPAGLVGRDARGWEDAFEAIVPMRRSIKS